MNEINKFTRDKSVIELTKILSQKRCSKNEEILILCMHCIPMIQDEISEFFSNLVHI